MLSLMLSISRRLSAISSRMLSFDHDSAPLTWAMLIVLRVSLARLRMEYMRGVSECQLKALAVASRDFFPELRPQIQLIHGLNQATDVVAEYLTKRLVDLRRLSLTPHAIPELRLYHVEGRLHVAALVIRLHEAFVIEGVEVVHALPKLALVLITRLLLLSTAEGDVSHSAVSEGVRAVSEAVVALIRRDFAHLEVARGRIHKGLKEGAIILILFAYLYGGNHVGCNA